MSPPAVSTASNQTAKEGRARRDRLERRIEREARRFDLIALLDLLEHLGYATDDIQFRSRLSATSAVSLIESVDFRDAPSRTVIVTLNMGLMTGTSPLPTYFFKVLERSDIREEVLENFLAFFDHGLILDYLRAIYPERDVRLFPDFQKTRERTLRLLSLSSSKTLHWLFQLVFPDLEQSVESGMQRKAMKVEGIRLGEFALGSSTAFGSDSRVTVPGCIVRLYVDGDLMGNGKPWAREVEERLHRLIFPVLARSPLFLEVALVIRNQKTWARLRGDSYLGYDRIRGGNEATRTIRIFRGQVGTGGT